MDEQVAVRDGGWLEQEEEEVEEEEDDEESSVLSLSLLCFHLNPLSFCTPRLQASPSGSPAVAVAALLYAQPRRVPLLHEPATTNTTPSPLQLRQPSLQARSATISAGRTRTATQPATTVVIPQGRRSSDSVVFASHHSPSLLFLRSSPILQQHSSRLAFRPPSSQNQSRPPRTSATPTTSTSVPGNVNQYESRNIINVNYNYISGGRRNVNVKDYSNKGYSSIWCLKGHVVPPPAVLERMLNGGVPTGDQPSFTPIPKSKTVTRKDFPPDFKFGCSTSALQTKGAGDEGGRGASTWDSFIQDGTGDRDIAVDSYHCYKDDVQILKKMGVDTYRLSIAWPRILPDGTVSGRINQQGIDFYNNFIAKLLKNGKKPFVTLFHFDLPQALQNKYRGFLSSEIVDDFKAYADLCFKTFGEVKYWTTINEPRVFGQYGYKVGMPSNPNANPASQGGEIEISLVTQWFMEPMVFGDYPFIMKALVRDGLPVFTEEEKDLVKGSFDFIGINYYTSRYSVSLPLNPDEHNSQDQFQRVEFKVDRNGKPIGQLAPGSDAIYVYPQGLRDALIYINKEYNNPKMYVTENGYPEKRDDAIPIETALQDNAKIQHILSHLYAVSEAREKGADVEGYFMWALMDCMEMGSGYTVRFGLNYTDYLNNLNRIPKKFAKWLNSFLGGSPK
ncbi:beta-glucosidase 10-like [Malania oleifera]|uniref:beta-glucosidase 10-like n=1 Tax=Malania oleifera TaxID=397392 RepID=UPI0025ADE261|nr:beta-glucosidase 10-like [Malania oleifera]